MRLFCALVLLFVALSAHGEPPSDVPSIALRHLSTTFVNRGMCAIRFGIESEQGGGDAGEVEIHLRFVNPAGKTLYRSTITTSLDDSTAGRYKEEFVEGEDICFPPETKVIITRATSKTGGKVYDLIKLHKIREDAFRSYRITVGQ